MNITEVIFGDSLFYTMSESQLGENKIIKFNTIFSIADLSLINQFKIILPIDIYKKKIIYDFSEEIQKLNVSINDNNKIRIWCSYQDVNSYILLTYISSYLKDKECNLYVVYSDESNDEFVSPSVVFSQELERLSEKEHKLTKNEIIELSNIWDIICTSKSDIRIMKNKTVKFVFYDYFDDIILSKLKKLGKVKTTRLVGCIMSDYYISDSIFLYLIERLIKLNKIIIVEKNKRLWNSIIAVKNKD